MSDQGISKYPAIPEYDVDLDFSNVDAAINTYVATRDDLATERKLYNTYEARAKNYMDRIEMWIKDKADELGVESFRTNSGTAYRSVKEHYKMSDWDSFFNWCRDNNYGHCIEKRAAKNAVREIHNETGQIPPGLQYEAEITFDVRRPTK